MIAIKKTIVIPSIFLIISGCDFFSSTHSKCYKSYSEITLNDGVNSWLPDIFPQNAVNISVKTNVEENYFLAFFSLENDEFEKKLQMNLRDEQLRDLKKINKNVNEGWCLYSEYNIWKEKRQVWYVIGKLKNENRYLLSYAANISSTICDLSVRVEYEN